MSKISKRELKIPSSVTVNLEKNEKDGRCFFSAQGPKGEQKIAIPEGVEIIIEKNKLLTTCENEELIPITGTYNSIIKNILFGVSNGYEVKMEIRGVGYNVEKKDSKLILNIGKSHPILVETPKDIEVNVVSTQKTITLKGIDKQKIYNFSSFLRAKKKPGTYHDKGIYYANEKKKLKPTKSVSKSNK